MKHITSKKFRHLGKRLNNNSAIILLVVVWMILILSLLTFSLSRKATIDLSLTKFSLGRFKAKFIAFGGVIYAIEQIRQDILDPATKQSDTLYKCGIHLEDGKSAEDVFKNVPLGEGYFDIAYTSQDVSSNPGVLYGLQDEERRLNINALSAANYKILGHLLAALGIDEEQADIIAASVVDWKDQDDTVTDNTVGAEDDYYLGLSKPYACKNLYFDTIEELLLVRGMTEEIYQKLQGYITILPKKEKLLVNFETASTPVLLALARNSAGPGTQTILEDADSLVNKIVSYRMGTDRVEMTPDDAIVDMNKMGLNKNEEVIFLAITPYRTPVSQYLRVHSVGTDASTKVRSSIDAIVYRGDLSVVYWRRK